MSSARSFPIIRAFAIVTGGLLSLCSALLSPWRTRFRVGAQGNLWSWGSYGKRTTRRDNEGRTFRRFPRSTRAYNCNLELVGRSPKMSFKEHFPRMARVQR